jgi:transcriptional regulator with XRE-family HTH domain
MSFGARLKEERKRLGLKQAEFAALVGTDVPKQSLYENDKRELRAAYLSRIAAAEVDVLYVITGRRSEGLLDEPTSAFLAAYLELPAELRETVRRLLADLSQYIREGPGQAG